jgi:hypothetical protein
VGSELESPTAGPDSLYRARGDEVSPNRPIFTGDVFVGTEVHALGEIKTKDVIVLQHPCSLRTNGVDLQPRLLVAELRRHKIIEDWTSHISKMPLPEVLITVTSGRRHQAAFFDDLYFVAPEQLWPERRVACLTPEGVNLLLQRWVFHNSRVVAETWKIQKVTGGPYDEADLTEEWVDERTLVGINVHDAMLEALDWLRATSANGETRQRMLEDPQKRSPVRQEMRAHLRSLES